MATEQTFRSIAQGGAIVRRGAWSVPVSVVLALVGGASRLPFVRETPINWDGVQFVLALEQFDLHAHQPHPPGYILYVLIGRMVNLAVGDPSLALSLLSVLLSALALPAFYHLVIWVFDDPSIAWGATIMMAASPLALYYGAVGLTYLPELLLSVVVAALAWRMKSKLDVSGVWAAALLALALGVAGGVRQTSLVVMLPLCVWALWGARRRAWAAFGLTLAATCALWFVPLAALSDGLQSYLRENELLAGEVMARTSVVDAGIGGLAHNLAFEGLALVIGLGLGIIPLGLWALRFVRFSLVGQAKACLGLRALPPLVLYAVSHVGQYGYLLVALPPLVMLSALCARVFGEVVAARRRRRGLDGDGVRLGMLACAAMALFSAGYFLLAEGPTTASNIAQNDDHWRAVKSALRNEDPASTILVMGIEWVGPFRHAGYLLPQYRSYGVDLNEHEELRWLYLAYEGISDYALPTPAGQDQLKLPPGTERIVALDGITAERFAPEGRLECVQLSDGSTLYIVTMDDGPRTERPIEALVIECERIELVVGSPFN